MAYPSAKFVAMPSLQQTYFSKLDGGAFGSSVNVTGGVLSSGTIEFFRDAARTIQKPVYQISDTPAPDYTFVEVPNPLTLSATGCIVNPSTGQEIVPYLYPYLGDPVDGSAVVDLYYITVKNSTGTLQTFQAAWPPGVSIPVSDSSIVGAQNLLSNPQFIQTIFTVDPATGACVYTVSGTNTVTPIAPGWDLVTTGSGSVTVKQIAITNTTATTNPPYALDIQGAGSLSSLVLRQRLINSPRIIANSFVSGSFVVNSQDSGSHVLTLSYTPSTGTAHSVVAFTTTGSLAFESATGAAQINGTINTQSATTGYVDISLTIPVLAHIQVSSFQLVQVSAADIFPTYYQSTTSEQISDLYWNDRYSLNFKPVNNLLTAWDFSLNPAQEGESRTITGTPIYIWDCLICASSPSNVNVARNSLTGGINFTTTGANAAFYMLQYVTGAQAAKILGTSLSVNIQGHTSSVGVNVTARVYLFRASAAATIPNLPTTIGTIASTGVFTLTAANWTEIPRSSQNQAIAYLPQITANADINSAAEDVGFSGWELTSSSQIGDTTKYAIVVSLASANNGTSIAITSINLAPGDIPTRPAPQIRSTVLRECQSQWEQTYESGVAAGTSTTNNAVRVMFETFQDGANTYLVNCPFTIQFAQEKRVDNAVVTFYGTGGTINTVLAVLIYNLGLAGTASPNITTNWTATSTGTQRRIYTPVTNATLITFGSITLPSMGYISFHYTVNARPGVV